MKQLLHDNHADIAGGAAMMGVVIATLIAIVVGVLIWYKLNAAVFSAAGAHTQTVAVKAMWNSTNATANTIWTLFPIICIVIIAGIVLAVVMGFGRTQA